MIGFVIDRGMTVYLHGLSLFTKRIGEGSVDKYVMRKKKEKYFISNPYLILRNAKDCLFVCPSRKTKKNNGYN